MQPELTNSLEEIIFLDTTLECDELQIISGYIVHPVKKLSELPIRSKLAACMQKRNSNSLQSSI